MKRIGLTGGIGCGKSTVVAELRRLGISCFVADEVARSYYSDGSFVSDVEDALGEKFCAADGTVDRKTIARKVFSDRRQLDTLNRLVHPRVMNDFGIWCAERQHEPVVFFESAILFEYGLDRMMDAVVTVFLERGERIRRLLQRDKCSVNDIETRMRNQLPDEQKAMLSDYVILNYEGNPRARQVKFIVDKICKPCQCQFNPKTGKIR